MIESTVERGSLGGVACQFMEVNGRGSNVSDVEAWLLSNPWIFPCGRIALKIEHAAFEVTIAIIASLSAIGFYELLIPSGNGWLTVASEDAKNIGNYYPAFVDMEVQREAGAG